MDTNDIEKVTYEIKKVYISPNCEEKCPYCKSRMIEHIGNEQAKCSDCKKVMELYK